MVIQIYNVQNNCDEAVLSQSAEWRVSEGLVGRGVITEPPLRANRPCIGPYHVLIINCIPSVV